MCTSVAKPQLPCACKRRTFFLGVLRTGSSRSSAPLLQALRQASLLPGTTPKSLVRPRLCLSEPGSTTQFVLQFRQGN
jgi:hypothetical protein